jgi:transposase
MCLFANRLEDDEFRCPKVQDGVMRLAVAQPSAVLEGGSTGDVSLRCPDFSFQPSLLRHHEMNPPAFAIAVAVEYGLVRSTAMTA